MPSPFKEASKPVLSLGEAIPFKLIGTDQLKAVLPYRGCRNQNFQTGVGLIV